MKYYPRDPARALEGMQGLTLEQVGAYNTILDHLYARDNVLPDDDAMLARMMRVNVQRWRRLRAELIAAGKIRVTIDGLLTANGVEVTMIFTSSRSLAARKAATLRWENFRKAKEINGTPMRHRNATKDKANNTEISTAPETSDEAAVDNGENFGTPKPDATYVTPSWAPDWTSCEIDDAIKAAVKRENFASSELAKVVRAKGWK